MEVFTDGRTANRQKALSVLAVAEGHIRRFQPRNARIGAARRLRSHSLTASPPHGSRCSPFGSRRSGVAPRSPRPFDPLSEQALTGSPSLRSGTARPAVSRGAREERARGGRSAARSPRRASTAHGWGGSRYSVWVDERGRPARAGGESLSGPLFEAEPSGAENIPVSGRERAGGFPSGGGIDQHRVGKN